MSRIFSARIFPSSELLFYDYERLTHFVQQTLKLRRQDNLLRIDYDIRRGSRPRTGEPHHLPQSPFYAIALHCTAESTTHGKTYAQAAKVRRGRPRPVKYCHCRREVSPTLLIYAFEIRMTQQSPSALVQLSRASLDMLIRFSRHTEGRSYSNLLFDSRNAGVASQRDYSRLPIRGNLVSQRPVCAPWRDGGKEPSGRPGSSCASEIRASSIACAGWVGMYAWA
jgi:hypothetical protein